MNSILSTLKLLRVTYNRHHFILLLLLYSSCAEALSNKSQPFLRRIRSIIPQKLPLALPWYEDGLDFSCTGCSKCCQVDGDVWLAPEEVSTIVQFLGNENKIGSNVNNVSPIDEFRKSFVRAEIAPAGTDGDHSQSWMCLKRKEGACVFLDPSGKCGIYDDRPIQCRTYPFWPSLLESSEDWAEESVLPDDLIIDEEKNERHWSAEHGGCEGIGIGKIIDIVAASAANKRDVNETDLENLLEEQQKKVIIDRQEIQAKRREAKKHWKRFPGEDIKYSSWYL